MPETTRASLVLAAEFVGDDRTQETILERAIRYYAHLDGVVLDRVTRRVFAPAGSVDKLQALLIRDLGFGDAMWLVRHADRGTNHLPDHARPIARCRTRSALADAALRLLSAAGIHAVGVTEESGPAVVHVAEEEWSVGARLLLALPGSEEDGHRSLGRTPALSVSSPPPPSRELGVDASFEPVAYHAAWDPLAAEAVWSTLLDAGIAPVGIDNAGGSSVSVPADQAPRARQVLSNLSGARLGPDSDAAHLGRIRIAEPDGHPRATRPDAGVDESRVPVAEFSLFDDGFGWQVASALHAARCDPLGRYEDGPGHRRVATIDVPAEHIPRARSVLRVVASIWPPGKLIVHEPEDQDSPPTRVE